MCVYCNNIPTEFAINLAKIVTLLISDYDDKVLVLCIYVKKYYKLISASKLRGIQ